MPVLTDTRVARFSSWEEIVRSLILGTISVLTAVAMALPAAARSGDWERIGGRSLDRQFDRTTLKVGRELGTFTKLRVSANLGSIAIRSIRVIYSNGRSEELIDRRIRLGRNRSTNFDLSGTRRYIEEIRVEARRRRDQSRRTNFEIQGESSGGARVRKGYEVLETRDFGRGATVVNLPIGADEGRFGTLRVRSLDDTISVRTMRVTFADGSTENYKVDQRLRAGQETDEIDLPGRLRRVASVRLGLGRTNNNGVARVQVLGSEKVTERPQVSDDDYYALGDRYADTRQRRIRIPTNTADDAVGIRVEVRGADLDIRGIELNYKNGRDVDYDLRQRVRDGRTSDEIEIRQRSGLEAVTLTVNPTRRRGSVEVSILARDEARNRIDSSRLGPTPRLNSRGKPQDMIEFGSARVGFRTDRDVIEVGRELGQFENIAFRILDRGILLRTIVIVYANGDREELGIGARIRANSVTNTLKLDGNRFIDRIELVSRAIGRGSERATVEVYGTYSDRWLNRQRAKSTDDWTLLGSQRAQMLSRDDDAFSIGRRFGRLDALRFRARGNEIRLYGVTVTYGNGDTEKLNIYGRLKRGQYTETFELPGRRGRFIERISVKYRSKFSLRGEGSLQVFGRQVRQRRSERERGGDRDDVRRALRNFRDLFKN